MSGKRKSGTDRALLGKEGFDGDAAYSTRAFPVERRVVARAPAGKPSTVVTPNRTLLVSYICGYGHAHDDREQPHQIEVIRSQDGGRTWSRPACAVAASWIGGDNYLIAFDDDHLLLGFMVVRINEQPHPWQGPYLCESTDGGRTWSDPWQVDISAFCQGPYGAADRGHIVMPDGRLFFFVGTYEDPPKPYEYLMISQDRGRTFSEWRRISDISGDSSFALCKSGAIAGALRVNADNFPRRGAHAELAEQGERVHFLAYTRSEDEGKTWSEPVPLTGWNEIPGHLLQLSDGRMLLTYGVRHYPLGIQAILTDGDETTWDRDNRIVLAWHGAQARAVQGYIRHSCGHPVTVELRGRELFTVYYMMADPFDPGTFQIEGVRWKAPT